MQQETTKLQQRIASGRRIVLAEIAPPTAPDAAHVRALARGFANKIHALGVSDNREGVRMSALAAASLVAAEGVEPILHMTTRDRSRVALIADCLGAHALGVRNLLCTSGTHQSLLPFSAAKNVFDIDATLLLQSCKDLEKDASIVGEKSISLSAPFCLGAVASPSADPLELQLSRLARKISVGAQFLVTQPVFDLERFVHWWREVAARGLHTKAAFVAGVKVLTDASSAKAYAEKRPVSYLPDAVVGRLAGASGPGGRAEGIRIALEIVEKLSAIDGLRGFQIACDDDSEAALEVLDAQKAHLG